MFTSAPPGPTLPRSTHGWPSAFTQGDGGAGSAIATGAAAIAAAAAPANNMGVIFVSFTIMRFGYHHHAAAKPLGRLTRRTWLPPAAATAEVPAPVAPTA